MGVFLDVHVFSVLEVAGQLGIGRGDIKVEFVVSSFLSHANDARRHLNFSDVVVN